MKLNDVGKGCLKVAGGLVIGVAGANVANAIVKAVPNPAGKVAAIIGVNVLYVPVVIGAQLLINNGIDQIALRKKN